MIVMIIPRCKILSHKNLITRPKCNKIQFVVAIWLDQKASYVDKVAYAIAIQTSSE